MNKSKYKNSKRNRSKKKSKNFKIPDLILKMNAADFGVFGTFETQRREFPVLINKEEKIKNSVKFVYLIHEWVKEIKEIKKIK